MGKGFEGKGEAKKKRMDLTDEQLVLNAKSGEASAYGQLFEKYQGGIYNFACALLKSTEDAKDIVQEAFIKVFEALPRLEDKLNFSAYLYKTARNLALDELKKKNRLGAPEALEIEEDTHIYSDPQRTSLLQEQQAQVRKVAASLPEDFRVALTLRELQNLPYEQISSIMGVPKNTVGVLLLRARLKFKQEFRMSQVNVEQLSKECEAMLPLLSGYIDNELTDEQKEKVKNHLKDCPLCRLALEEITEASQSYRALIPFIPPFTLKEEVLSRIRELFQSQSSPPQPEPSLEPSLEPAPEPATTLISPTASSPTTPLVSLKTFMAKIAALSLTKKVLILTTVALLLGGALGSLYALNVSNNERSTQGKSQVENKSSTVEKEQAPKKINAPLNAPSLEKPKQEGQERQPGPEEEVENQESSGQEPSGQEGMEEGQQKPEEGQEEEQEPSEQPSEPEELQPEEQQENQEPPTIDRIIPIFPPFDQDPIE